jgi:tetratricopeptide (TPR) repeat protein
MPSRVTALAFAVLAIEPPVLPAAEPPTNENREASLATRACFAATDAGDAVNACRKALASAEAPGRREALARVLALRLAALERWDEAARAFEDLGRLRPTDAEARLGLAASLLHGLGRPEAALAPLDEAAGLLPDDPRPWIEKGLALAALGRHADAVAAFDEALKRDGSCLESRPAAAAVVEAARHGDSWPQGDHKGRGPETGINDEVSP